MKRQISRRRLLGGIGTMAAAGVLAGCSTETSEETDTPEDSGGDGGSTPTESGDGGAVPSEVSEYLSDAPNFDDSVEDMTGQDSVTVDVGGGGDLLFKPAAIRVSTGTTVTWEWQGGSHNVVHEDGDFESELYSSAGETFEQTFDEAGNVLYYCQPHEMQGMKGAVIVE